MEYKTEGLNELSVQLNDFVKSAGFNENGIPLRFALIHSEISEAFESFRKDKYANVIEFEHLMKENPESFKEHFEKHIKDSMEDELADSIIRLLEFCTYAEVDIEYHIQQKMNYNETRGFRFGGKKF